MTAPKLNTRLLSHSHPNNAISVETTKITQHEILQKKTLVIKGCLLRSSSEGRHDAGHEGAVVVVGVLAHKDVVDELQDDQLVDEHPGRHCQDEPRQLSQRQSEVHYGDYFSTDDTANANRCQPVVEQKQL